MSAEEFYEAKALDALGRLTRATDEDSRVVFESGFATSSTTKR